MIKEAELTAFFRNVARPCEYWLRNYFEMHNALKAKKKAVYLPSDGCGPMLIKVSAFFWQTS